MRQIKSILQLHRSQGLSMGSIARSLGVAYGSVHEILQRAEAAGLCWPLPEELDDEALAWLLYQGNQGRPRRRPEPVWATVDTELRRKGVTRELLRIVDQLLSAPLPPEERESLLRQMRHLLEPPPPEDGPSDQPAPKSE